MRLKTIATIVALLAVASGAVYYARRPEAPKAADARINQPLVDAKALDAAAKLRLSDQGKTVQLVRQTDGSWRVASYYDLPADLTKLQGFASNLTDAKIQELVTTSPTRIARLEFKDTKIELLDAADKALWSATLGKNRELGGGRYVRFGDEPKAYVTNLNAWLDVESKSWASAALLDVKPEEIAKVEILFAEGGPVTVSRASKDAPWTADKTPTNQRVKADKVAALLPTIGNVRFSETSAPDDANVAAAKANLRTFKFTTFDNKTYTVALGRKPEEKKPKPAAPAPAEPKPADNAAKKDGEAKPEEKKEPEFETVPAGPVFVFVTAGDAAAPVNGLMQKRAFQVYEHSFTSLPQKADELFEPAPAPAPAPTPAPAPEQKKEEKKSDGKK